MRAIGVVIFLACGGRSPAPQAQAPAPIKAPAPPPAPAATGPCNTTATCATQCEARSEEGCARLGAFTLDLDIPFSYERLGTLLRSGCSNGVATACLYAGLYMHRAVFNRKVDVDTQRVFDKERWQAYQKGCDGKQPRACDLLAGVSEPEKAKALHARAFALIEAACRDGDASSCDDLARDLQGGSIMQDDTDAARALMERAATAFERAAPLMVQACDRGDAIICHALAHDYTNMGYAVETDLTKSAELSRRACTLAPELCPATSTGSSLPAMGGGARPAPSGTTPIRIGDSIADVRRTYQLAQEPDTYGYAPGRSQYHLGDKGLWFFFSGGVVETIRLDTGAADGIAVGDSAQRLRSIRGEARSTSNDGNTHIYPSSYGQVRYDIEGGKVTKILLFK